MSLFATATKPAPAVNQTYLLLSYVLGLWVAGMAAAQMVSFEDFVHALTDYHVAGQRTTVAIAIGLLGAEIFAVPFLLRLTLSPAARFGSALLALVVPFAWTALACMALLGGATVPNAGYFGEFLAIPIGGLALTLDVTWLLVVSLSFRSLGGLRALRPNR